MSAKRVARNRFEVVAYTAKENRLKWASVAGYPMSLAEMATHLRRIADSIEKMAAAEDK